MLTNVTRFAVAGDWHGNLKYAQKAVHYAVKNNATTIIQLGDFGAWPNKKDGTCGFINALEQVCQRNNVHLLFIDGNHEHHPWLNSLPIDDDGVRRITSHVWHLPRGYRWEWQGVTFLTLGGAYSVDRRFSTLNVDYFENEVISPQDAAHAVVGGKVDVMFTHDCPNLVKIPEEGLLTLSNHVKTLAEEHRLTLGMVVDQLRPNHLYHGHYHLRYEALRYSPEGWVTQIHGMHKDKAPISLAQNVVVLNVEEFME